MKLIFALSIILFEILPVHFFQVVEIVRAFGVYAFVDDKVFPVLLRDKGISAVRTAQLHGREAAFVGGEPGGTDLAEELSFGAVVPVKERFWGITARAGAAVWDITFRAAADGANLFTIAFFIVRDKLFVSPFLAEISHQWERVDPEPMVLWGMGIIKGPLFKRDISADKAN